MEERAPDGGAEGEPGFVTAVNLGSNQRYVDEDGIVFEPDNFGIGARASTSAPVAGDEFRQTIYQSESLLHERSRLRLRRRERQLPREAALRRDVGRRHSDRARAVFDVVVEGRVVDDDLDVFREAGGRETSLWRKGATSVGVDGRHASTSTSATSVQNPAVKAVEIHRIPADARCGTGSAETTAPVVVKAVNLGSSTDYTARDGTLFEADDTGVGNWSPVSREIRGDPTTTPLYRTQVLEARVGELRLRRPRTAPYEVELHFAETWGRCGGARRPA